MYALEKGMWYTCLFCDYKSEYRHNVTKHCKRRHDDVPTSKKSFEDKQWVCKCGKSYAFQSGLSKHRRSCQTVTPPTVSVTVNGNNNMVHDIGNVYHNNITINITPFSSMKPEVTYEDFMEVMEGGVSDAIVKLITMNQFNAKRPESMNCYISNLKDKIGRVFEDSGWEVCESEDLALKVFEKYRDAIEEVVDEMRDEERAEEVRSRIGNVQKRLSRYMSKWEKCMSREEDELHSLKTIHLFLYNKKDLVRKIHSLRF